MAGIPLGLNFDLGSALPLDSRLVVNTFANLTSIPNQYSGMQVYAADTKKLYYLESTNSWLEVSLLNASVQTTGAQNISGTKTFISNIVLYSGVNVTFNEATNVVFSGTPVFNSGINSNVLLNTKNSHFDITSDMNGKMILVSGAANTIITGTIQLNLNNGYNVSITQMGSGQVFITGVNLIDIKQKFNLYSTAGQYSVVSLLHYGSNKYLLYGDLA